MMSNTSIKLLKVLFIVDILLIIISSLFFDTKVLLNLQIGFISSSLVMFASFLAYKRMINTRVEHHIITLDENKDVIDKLEDPYDLYSDDENTEEENVVELVKKERKRLKESGRSLVETLKDTKATLSVYRLGAYVLLILGFLYLDRHEVLNISAYILALGLPPIIIVIMLLREQEAHS